MDDPQIPHFMPGGAGGVGKMTENDENEHELKVCDHIGKMDDELKDRFKALYKLQAICNDLGEEEENEIRKLELVYEQKYKEIYS